MINAENNAQIRLESQGDYNWFSYFFDVLSDQKVGHRWIDENGNDVKISDPTAKLDVNGTYNGMIITRVPVIIDILKQAQTDEDFEYIFNRELKNNSQFSGPTNLFAQYLRDIVLEKKEEYVKSNKPSQINIQIIYIVDRFIQWLDTQTENKNSSAVGSQTGNIKNEKTFTDHSNNYEIKDYDQIQAIFNLCNNEYFESEFITFRDSIEKADFRKITIKRQTITQDLIYRLSGIFGKDWLAEVEDKNGWKKGICSSKKGKVKEYPEIKKLDKLIARPIKKAD